MQLSCSTKEEDNVDLAVNLVREAASAGAQVILLPELFAGHYFPQEQDATHFDLARPADPRENEFLAVFQNLSAELDVCLPISFFEKCNQAYFNSVAVFDGGDLLGIYRKTHIPDGPGYTEKFYFSPGDTGFKVFNTRFCKLSVLICWDQWFPEAARCCCLQGAELILYPTAIGSEPRDPTCFSRPHWQRTQQGHAAANLTPIIVANRIGTEKEIHFYGGSFIADATGEIVQQFSEEQQTGVLLHTFDLDAVAKQRRGWGVFRDRRPEHYGAIASLTGLTGTGGSAPETRSKEASSVPTMPAEWAEHAACWMAWPHKKSIWRKGAVPAQRQVAAVALAIAEHEPVRMLVIKEELPAALQALPPGCGVELIPAAYDDIWLRDSGPSFVVSRGELGAVEWAFNGWGSGEEFGIDLKVENAVSGTVARLAGVTPGLRHSCAAVLEGGSFHIDGLGTVVTTEECVLNANRANKACPVRSRSALEAILRKYLGARKVIFLPRGVVGDEDTNGHVDNLCTFVKPGHVVLTWPEDETTAQYAVSREASEILTAAGLVVHRLVHPAPTMYYSQDDVDGLVPPSAGLEGLEGLPLRKVGTPLAASYINYYLCSGGRAVVMPRFGLPTDQVAADQLQALFPHARIVQVDAREILLGGGNIHCITQQQPKV